jgi:hypothetical protein
MLVSEDVLRRANNTRFLGRIDHADDGFGGGGRRRSRRRRRRRRNVAYAGEDCEC